MKQQSNSSIIKQLNSSGPIDFSFTQTKPNRTQLILFKNKKDNKIEISCCLLVLRKAGYYYWAGQPKLRKNTIKIIQLKSSSPIKQHFSNQTKPFPLLIIKE